jgi:ketosteroid isomerase-like protein
MVLGPARTPEEIHAILADAFGRGDLDALVDLYEEDAVLVVPTDGRIVRGRTDIRAATAPVLAASPRLTSVVERKLESGGLALTHARWELVGRSSPAARTGLGESCSTTRTPRRDMGEASMEPRTTYVVAGRRLGRGCLTVG